MDKAHRKFSVPAALRNSMIAYGLSDTDHEVCGLLGGSGANVYNFYPVRNIAVDTTSEFFMDPEQQIEAMRRMRQSGESLVGIFHSHPHARAIPSARDLQQAAYPCTIHLILSLSGVVPDLRAYYYDGDKFSDELILSD